jgi:acetyl-CoA carboxylase biotin carboxylase subunit
MGEKIQKLLIANRGEIARRIMRTCRDLGIATVAVFSDADEGMPFVREADEAVRIGPAPSQESYLKIEGIIDAAKRTGAEAIHPGYGFLAENAAFAEACAEAGIIFVGPSPSAIRSMGSKREAKALVAAANVPVIPGYDGADQNPEILAKEAKKIDFPVLLKASAGGGGKGMRIVRTEDELPDAIAGARREAEGSFGDGALLVEKYIERPRHVEIQIIGDQKGALVHLFERECSVQRRYQKIIEEAPSPALNEELRAKMGQAAIAAGQAIAYYGAGTVEFILDANGDFFFLEVNTRLQVEHPVTECITGLDLVAIQIAVAQGESLGFAQEDLRLQGAAVEARLYAEDPDQGFLPGSGGVIDWHCESLEGVRYDAGVEAGSEVGIHYDPMLAKIIASGSDRGEAIRRLRSALRHLSVQGLVTNREFLVRVLEHPRFIAGDIDTHFVQDSMGEAPALSEAWLDRGLIAAALWAEAERREARPFLGASLAGYRNSRFALESVEFALAEEEYGLRYVALGDERYRFVIGERELVVRRGARSGRSIDIEVDGIRSSVRVVWEADQVAVQHDGIARTFTIVPRFPDASGEDVGGGCTAPMPGKIVEVRVEAGNRVEAGDTLVIMEAMKMEHSVVAPHEGLVTEVRVSAGDQVDADAVLVIMEDEEAAAD